MDLELNLTVIVKFNVVAALSKGIVSSGRSPAGLPIPGGAANTPTWAQGALPVDTAQPTVAT